LAAAAVAAVGLLVGGYAYRGERLARLEAVEARRTFPADVQTAQVLLLDRNADRGQLNERTRVRETDLARYGVLAGAGRKLGRPGPVPARPPVRGPGPTPQGAAALARGDPGRPAELRRLVRARHLPPGVAAGGGGGRVLQLLRRPAAGLPLGVVQPGAGRAQAA